MLPVDYEERVYAGVLGKIIAVYLGRPFEGWTNERIVRELGEITGYVNDRTDVALKHHLLVVPDDDISGTFVFPRALRDYGPDPTAGQVAATWLNNLIEGKTVLWWGGLGNSTEHTAYLRLRSGVEPPRSGSAELNGTVVSEQVGAEIFVEGFAMTCPGDAEHAADLAARAASVSHDGEAVHAARVVAGLVAQAFVEPDMERLLDVAMSLIPGNSLVHQVIDDVRAWRAIDNDWRITRKRIDEQYGYHRYGGNCHVIPNHALIINALAYSGGDFSEAMTIVNTCGWDTDSNSGNVGAITGVRGGLAGIADSWRDPVADRMYLPSADGGAAVTDAAREALIIAGYGRARANDQSASPKNGARFHFTLPGSVQGFTTDLAGGGRVVNSGGELALSCPSGALPVSATTPTFIPPEATGNQIYGLEASPTLYSGQALNASVRAGEGNAETIRACLVVHVYDSGNELRPLTGQAVELAPGASVDLNWQVPDTDGQPIVAVGIKIDGGPTAGGTVYLDYLTWDGEPEVKLTRPAGGGQMWRRAWVSAVDRYDEKWPEPFRIVQNRGSGMLIQGTRDWSDYQVTADITPHVVEAAGVAGRVQGLRRFYAVELVGTDQLRLIRELDGQTVLASIEFPWSFGRTYHLGLRFAGDHIEALVDDAVVISHTDRGAVLRDGAVALTVTEGRTATTAVSVQPTGTVRTPHPRGK